LNGDRETRWATAVVLARLGSSDGDALARDVMSEFDPAVIPSPDYHYWEQAAWHLEEALYEGRTVPGVRELALDALARADLQAAVWTDVVDEAIGILRHTPRDAETITALQRVAAEHWSVATRDRAEAILENPPPT
jgi:hypothetical protein